MRIIYELLTSPLGLPIDSIWEYAILLIVSEVVHLIAWKVSPGGSFGSTIYWITKLVAFVVIWGVLYGVIALTQLILTHWYISLIILLVTALSFVTFRILQNRSSIYLK